MARIAVSKDNTTPLIEIVTWFCLVVSILTVISRLGTKHYVLHRFNLDDYSIFISLVYLQTASIAE